MLLDLGCGTGMNALWLAQQGFKVTGIDFSMEKMRELILKIKPYNNGYAALTADTGTVAEIQEVTDVIGDMNDIVSTIASAVEEQSIATREISQNTSHVSQGIFDAHQQVAQGADSVREITESIHEVHKSSTEMNTRSSKIKLSAFELTQLADLGQSVEETTAQVRLDDLESDVIEHVLQL